MITIYPGPHHHDSSLGPIRADRPLPATTIDYICATMTALGLTPSDTLAVHLDGEAPPIIEACAPGWPDCELCHTHALTLRYRLHPDGEGRTIIRVPCRDWSDADDTGGQPHPVGPPPRNPWSEH